MAKVLDVYLIGKMCGQLVQDDDGKMSFQYSAEYAGEPQSLVLSHSLPLRGEPFTQRACEGFFSGLLPEENKRKSVAKILGVSPENSVAMLAGIGGECAGGVTFLSRGKPYATEKPKSLKLTKAKLASILRELKTRPLLAGEEGVRLSLAGAQDKIVVSVSGEDISVPLEDSPSSHVLKPDPEPYPNLVFNEDFCMRLARAMDLPASHTEVGRAEDINYLLVERFDRETKTLPGSIFMLVNRLHQEDFCQALGLRPALKYEAEGGPSLKRCVTLIRDVSDNPAKDVSHFVNAVVFNYLIGNHDAHAKNFSFLYEPSRTLLGGTFMKMAPLYDLVSTVCYPTLTKKMAMKLDGEYESSRVVLRHFEGFAEEAGLSKPLIRKRVQEFAELMLSKLADIAGDHFVARTIAEIAETRCHKLL